MNNQSLIDAFLKKFKADRTQSFGAKLASIGIAKATYADFIYGRRTPKKKTLEAIKAYLEERPTKYETIDSSIEFYCCTCEEIKPLLKQFDRWTCKPCKNKNRSRNRKKHWNAFLIKRANLRLKKKYGSFAECMRSIIKIKQEIKKYKSIKV